MKEREAWDRFLATGKVEDYLACVGKFSSTCKNEKMGEKEFDGQMKDVVNGAGFSDGDGPRAL